MTGVCCFAAGNIALAMPTRRPPDVVPPAWDTCGKAHPICVGGRLTERFCSDLRIARVAISNKKRVLRNRSSPWERLLYRGMRFRRWSAPLLFGWLLRPGSRAAWRSLRRRLSGAGGTLRSDLAELRRGERPMRLDRASRHLASTRWTKRVSARMTVLVCPRSSIAHVADSCKSAVVWRSAISAQV